MRPDFRLRFLNSCDVCGFRGLGSEFQNAIPRAEIGLRMRVPVPVLDFGFATLVPKLVSDFRVPMPAFRVRGSKFGRHLPNPTSDPTF